MGSDDRRRAQIVDFWRAVEYFEPTTVPRPTRRRTHRPVLELRDEAHLPWEPEHRYQGAQAPRRGRQWRHTVYCGVFELEDVQRLLEERFGVDDEDADEYSPGQSALLAFDVDSHGRALLESDALSSCGWAVGRTLSPGPGSPDWLDGFDGVLERFRLAFEWLVTEPAPEPVRALSMVLGQDIFLELGPDGLWDRLEEALENTLRELGDAPSSYGDPDAAHRRRRRPLTRPELDACLQAAIRLTGAEEFIPEGAIRVESRLVADPTAEREEHRQDLILHSRAAARGECDPPAERPDPGETAFLNSFIAEDLGRVARAARHGDVGRALAQYLTSEEDAAKIERVDLRAEGAGLADRVTPLRTPLARWPGKDTHPLALSQQVAVNSIVESLRGGAGVFAVNGPPGTGKTTLLRDLIAHAVVERARALARLEKPEDAFLDKSGWKTEDGETRIHPFRPELTGHEIVVASANNGAVENVTAEIPSLQAIDEQWRGQADYFARIGTRLLQGMSTKEEGESSDADEAWGTMAAQLGNMSNRTKFAAYFWRGGFGTRENGRWVPPPGGMKEVLAEHKAVKRPSATRANRWRKAVEDFTTASARAERERELRDRVRAESAGPDPRVRRAGTEAASARRAAEAASEEASDLHRKANQALGAVQSARSRVSAAEAALREHAERQPGVLRTVTSLGRQLREWREKELSLQDALAEAERVLANGRGSVDRFLALARAAEERAHRARATAELGERERREALAELERTRQAVRDHIPSPDATDEERELSSPWNDPAMARARTEVFLAALRLHQAFLEAVPGQMSRNLDAAVTVLKGGQPAGAPRQAILAAWQSLFFVVPVVSTTFASFARLFSHMRREELGWLLIDEAGQATPQQAVGALWRAKRAVVVGDPLQLEPICTLPFTAQQALRNFHGVEEKWLPAWTSVQALADQVTPLGTELDDANGDPIWVGSPLRVHRRCDDPMYEVSNEVAYDGMMVKGTPPRKDFPAYRSLWIDVDNPSGEAQGHWIPREGMALRRVLKVFHETGLDMKQIFVISPFREVAGQALSIAREFGVTDGGTIHRTQGKEADIVVFVLGGDPRRAGARRWAAKKPNLVNVAASRAKRRLYVIGDHESWSREEHFQVLAGKLGDPWRIPL